VQERYPPIEPYDHGMLDVGDGGHGAVARAPRRRALAAVRRLVGLDLDSVVIDDSGHTGSGTMREEILRTVERLGMDWSGR
jgi:hypothetical protein